MKKPKVTVVLGSQWGDEGKGKVVDMLSSEVDIVCRCQGGSNASHTVVTNGRKFYFHLLPSGIMNENCICIIGNGVIIHLSELFEELETNTFYNYQNRLIISNRAHLVFDFHQQVDGMQEAEKSDSFIGTTKKGIGPTYSSKISRTGIRVSDLLGDFKSFKEKLLTIVATYQRQFPNLHVDIEKELDRYQIYAKKLRPFVRNTVSYIHNALGQGKRILVEGANGAMLDIDFGTYPYVTSSNCTIGGVITGLGIPPQNIGEVIGVVKAYTTRVGQGPFPTELKNTIGELLQTHGGEFSIVTQTKRRCGWLDLPLLKYSSIVNGYTAICLTKLDTLDKLPTIDVGVGYTLDGKPIDYWPDTVFDWTRIEVTYTTLPGWQTSTEDIGDFNKLPVNAQNYVRFVENELDIPIRWIGVGPGRDSIITIRK